MDTKVIFSDFLQRRVIRGFPLKKSVLAMSGALLASTGSINVYAQDENQQQRDSSDQVLLEEIVVTGTLIRGVQATGSQTIGINREEIIERGAATTNELLGSLPQVANFFNDRPEQDPRGADRLQVNRPNLRSLPGINAATGATTLILVDGHRMTPMGVDQSSFDPDFIPRGIIERVEVITDGGSSLYGADAVGGVINFITRKEFDGVQIDLGYDIGDDYNAWNTTFTAGTSWENGSGYISLATSDRDEVLIKDRDWASQGQWNADGTVLSPSGSECLEPVGAVTNWFWFGAGWTDNPAAPGAGVTPVGEPCDTDAENSLIPEQQRDNIFIGLTQELSDTVTFDMKSYFGERTATYNRFPEGDTVSEPGPNELGVQGDFIGQIRQSAAVGFSYGAHPAYVHRNLEVEIQTWGFTPEVTIALDNGWQWRNTVHWGRSDSETTNPGSNRGLLVDYVNQGLLDPTNVAAADASVVNDILDWETAGQSVQELFLLKSVADGAIMDLPAGALRAAVGVEFAQDRARLREGDGRVGALSAREYNEESRDLRSVFAELSVPVTSMLDLSLSLRHDDYSDFGETTNPNIGFTFTPADWLSIYGHWGESFNAPTVLDSLGTANARFIANAAPGVPDPNGERDPNRNDALLLEGASGTLLPQTAETWAIGFKVEPLQGLTVDANYYEIDFKDLLGAVNAQSIEAVLLNPDKFIFNPTQEEFDAFLAATENGVEQFGDIDAADVGIIVDRRTANTNEALLRGIDFAINYFHDTDFGNMSYGLSGNHQLKFDLTQSGNVVDQLESNRPDLALAGNIGWARENVRARLTLKYSDGFDTDSAVNQTSVSSFLVTDLFVGYDFSGGSAVTDGLSLRFNVDNLFDEDPPLWRRQRLPNYSGWTLGRVFKLGITKTF